jgi:TFIIF-interacting CTD phosphatase-like protein
MKLADCSSAQNTLNSINFSSIFEDECNDDESPPMELFYGTKPPRAPLLPPQSKEFKGKYTLILDLDQTLVYSSLNELGSEAIFLPVYH